MFANILVPADLTHRNEASVRMACRLLSKSGEEKGRLHLFHVIETIPGFSIDDERQFYSRLERAASEHLEVLGAIATAEGVDWDAEVAYGARAQTIIRTATKNSCDLIVIRSHRVDRERPQEGWGTLSYQVGIFATCPVLLVK